MKWSFIVLSGWPEIVRVPGSLDAITGDVKGNADEGTKDSSTDSDTP